MTPELEKTLKRSLGFLSYEDLVIVGKVAGVGVTFVKAGQIKTLRRPTIIRRLLAWASAQPTGSDDLAEYARLARHGKLIVGTPPEGTEEAGRVLVAEDRVRGLIQSALREEFEFEWDDAAVVSAATRAAVAAVEERRKVELTLRAPWGDRVVARDWVAPPAYERVLRLASQRVNCLMVGPTGSGKSYLAERVADDLGMRFGLVNCSMGLSESQLAGWLIPVKAGGAFAYVPAPFVDCFEKGGVFLFDELDRADPNTMTFLNGALSNGTIFIPQRSGQKDGGRVARHADSVILAAANTFGTGADMKYVGANQLDAATLDRFAVGRVLVDYCRDVEASLGTPEVCRWAWAVRAAIEECGLRRIMSTRTIKDLTTMTRGEGWGRDEWERSYFTGWSDDERGPCERAGRAA